MTQRSRDPQEQVPLNPPEVPLEDKQRELEGRQTDDTEAAFFDISEVDNLGSVSDTEQYLGEIEAGVHDDLPNDEESLEMLTELELRAEETDNAFVAAEEGLTYVPPIDPPTVPSDDFSNAQVAAGFSVSAMDEPYDEDQHSGFYPGGDEMSERVRDALRADSMTTQYADSIRIITRGNTVILRGMVEDLDDSDSVVAVAQYVEGVDEVIDELDVRTMQ